MCQGRQSRRVGRGRNPPPPPELAVDKLGGLNPPLILREYLEKLITYMLFCTCYFYRGGGGGWLPLN